LTMALGLDGSHNGVDVTDLGSCVRVGPAAPAVGDDVRSGPRVGVAGAGAGHPWRFWLDGEPTVSAYRPAVARRRSS
jgi:DNA-3-methyladenine glycosylase